MSRQHPDFISIYPCSPLIKKYFQPRINAMDTDKIEQIFVFQDESSGGPGLVPLVLELLANHHLHAADVTQHAL